MISSGGPREIPHGTSSIASRWQQLASTNLRSPQFVSLLASLTAEDNRSSTAMLCGADAKDVLSIMDEVSSTCTIEATAYVASPLQVMKNGKIPSKYEHYTLNTMRKLAYNSGQVPSRYQVDRLSLTMEAVVIANGTSAEVRQGRLDDKTVAIRTLRNDRKVDKDKSQKVCVSLSRWCGRL